MPRPRNAVPSRNLHVALPGDLGARLDLHLFSTAEQRIPFAAHQKFILARVAEFFHRSTLHLGPYLPESQALADASVTGDPATILALKKFLEGNK